MKPVTLAPTSEVHGVKRPVTVHCGHLSVATDISGPDGDKLGLPADVLRLLPAPPGQAVGMWESPDGNHLHLGPLVGIVWEWTAKPGHAAATGLFAASA